MKNKKNWQIATARPLKNNEKISYTVKLYSSLTPTELKALCFARAKYNEQHSGYEYQLITRDNRPQKASEQTFQNLVFKRLLIPVNTGEQQFSVEPEYCYAATALGSALGNFQKSYLDSAPYSGAQGRKHPEALKMFMHIYNQFNAEQLYNYYYGDAKLFKIQLKDFEQTTNTLHLGNRWMVETNLIRSKSFLRGFGYQSTALPTKKGFDMFWQFFLAGVTAWTDKLSHLDEDPQDAFIESEAL
jgi:hypothetical protein